MAQQHARQRGTVRGAVSQDTVTACGQNMETETTNTVAKDACTIQATSMTPPSSWVGNLLPSTSYTAPYSACLLLRRCTAVECTAVDMTIDMHVHVVYTKICCAGLPAFNVWSALKHRQSAKTSHSHRTQPSSQLVVSPTEVHSTLLKLLPFSSVLAAARVYSGSVRPYPAYVSSHWSYRSTGRQQVPQAMPQLCFHT